jgi:hypothetical protein
MDGFGADDQRARMAARYAKQHAKPKGGDRKSVKARTNQPTDTGRGLISDSRSRATEQPALREAAATMNVTPTRTEKAGRGPEGRSAARRPRSTAAH